MFGINALMFAAAATLFGLVAYGTRSGTRRIAEATSGEEASLEEALAGPEA